MKDLRDLKDLTIHHVHRCGSIGTGKRSTRQSAPGPDNLLVRIYFIIVMIRWTGLAPWEFEFPFPGSLTSTFRGLTGVVQSGWGGARPGSLPLHLLCVRDLSL